MTEPRKHAEVQAMHRAVAWVVTKAWEKLDIVATWRALRDLGREHGLRFLVAAAIWEFLFEDFLFPLIAWRLGHPGLIPVLLLLHFEPVVYPVFFFGFRTWDRLRGRVPWEPDRRAASTYTRTAVKALSYRVFASILFLTVLGDAGLDPRFLPFYAVGMTGFSFAHERIWHDSNFGIDVDADVVHSKRLFAQVLTYRAVSTAVMVSLFLAVLGQVPVAVMNYEVGATFGALGLAMFWGNSSFGIVPTGRT